jgi:hypothetical protein
MPQGKLARIQQCISSKREALDWKKTVLTGLLLICVVWLAYRAYSHWETLQEFKWQIRYGWIVPSIVLFLVQTLVVVWGWRSILSRLAPQVPFRKHIKVYCSTLIARRVPAGILWTVAGRAYLYNQLDIPISTPAVASFLEQVLVVLAGLPVVALQIMNVTTLEDKYTPVVSGLALIIVAVLAQPSLLNQISRLFKHKNLEINLSYYDSLKWLSIYALGWLLSGIGLYIVINLFHHLSLQVLPEIIGVWTLASLVSYLTLLTPSGFGVKEVSLTFLLGAYLPEPLPLVVAISIRVIWTVYEIIAGLISLAL